MRKILLFFVLIISFSVSAQELEKSIYNALDEFLKNRSDAALMELSKKEIAFENKVDNSDEHLALVILQCNKAFFLKENGLLQQAMYSYEKARKRFTDHNLENYDIIEYCLKPLGNLYIQTKDFVNAENTIKYYISIAEKERKQSQKIAGKINLLALYQSINKHKVVVKIASESLNLYQVDEDQKKNLENIRNYSLLLMNANNEEVSSNYLNYIKFLKSGDFHKAKLFFERAKKERSIKISIRDKVKYLLEEAQLQLLLKNSVAANILLNDVLMNLIPTYQPGDHITQDHLYAESLLIDVFDMKASLSSTIENSLDNYNLSFYVSDLLERNISVEETKILLQSEKRKRGEKCIHLLLQDYEENRTIESLEQAFNYANKGKASSLKDRLMHKRIQKKYPNDSLLKIEESLKRQQVKLTSIILSLQKELVSGDSIQKMYNEYSKLLVQLKEVSKSIREKYANYFNEEVSLLKIQQKLKDKETALVNYFFGEKNLYQFIITSKHIKVNTIKVTSGLQKTILDYIRFFNSPSVINNNVSDYVLKSHNLYKKLKFDELKKYKNIALITDGLLNFIPFETLLSKKTEDLYFENMPFVMKEHKIAYAFNTNTFLNSNGNLDSKSVTGFFPVFEGTIKELSYSLDEADIIEKEYSSDTYKNEKATKDKFIETSEEAEILHVSTHSRNTGVISDAYIEFYDEKLYLNDLYSLECNADLVVLSACDTGIGTLVKGEGAMSIARGFSYLGVENLMFTLWEINDKSTSEVIRNFYTSLKKVNTIDDASRTAKLKYLNNPEIENPYKSPYYWGAFVYYGSVSENQNTSQLFYVILGLVILIIIFLQIAKKKF
ncbi:CHAT domain-containing protein [Tenacibaculum sp. 190524A05c]|uniref:CHAT domain-containing protein n=1 Tax=Tenacibaculum platacis TaxID=3137852 RepID=UPI0031FA5293